MYIQYVGFDVGRDSPIYSFDVVSPGESRHFTVEVRLDAFRPFQLRLQDGPDLCFACLKRGLAEETSDAPVVAHLSLGEEDVREYLEAHRPVKTLGRRI